MAEIQTRAIHCEDQARKKTNEEPREEQGEVVDAWTGKVTGGEGHRSPESTLRFTPEGTLRFTHGPCTSQLFFGLSFYKTRTSERAAWVQNAVACSSTNKDSDICRPCLVFHF